MIRVTRSVIPNLFTVMNLFSGFVAVKAAMVDSDFVAAGWFIVLGAIFDTLDGLMARLTHSASEFGVELDSLADVVTFGVGPSAILYKLFFYQYGGLGLLLSAAPAMCGALRLARFNVQLVGFDKDYFKGLPIPSSALLIVSYVTWYHLHQNPNIPPETYTIAMFVIVIGASLLMVSTIKYDSIPKFTGEAIKAHPVKFFGFLLILVIVIVTKGSAIFPFFVLFILFGVVRSIFDRTSRAVRQKRAAGFLDEEELEAEEADTFGI